MLAQKFGFSQAELVKMLGVDQKAFASFFEPNSLKALTTDKKFNQTLGEPGALISLLFGNMIKVTSPIAAKLLNGVLGTHLTGDEYSAAEITKTIEFYMHYLTPFLKEINFANVVQEIGAILPKVKLGTDQVQSISNSVDGFVNGQINQNYVQPIVKGIISGVDLSHFANKTLDVMMAQMSNQIINALGYALRDDYKPIIALNDDVSSAASTLKEMITNKEFKNFKFNRNTEKFIESVTSVVAMLNHVLTIFKTPNVSFSVKEPQLHIFDDAKTNDEFAKDIYKKDLQTLIGIEALKTINVNELLSNLLYFVGGNNSDAQYRLQKLMYALLYQGDKISSLANFGASTGINIGLGKHS
jgi:MOLPALP family lipoprotein